MLKILLVALSLASQVPAVAPTSTPALEVAGKAPVLLTPQLLQGLPRAQASVPATEHGGAATYEGVTLRSILTEAGLPEGRDIRGEYLCWVVTLEAADDYKVVFALAELDPAFRDRLVLLADTRDGAPLSAQEAPLKLVVPDEKQPARWIRQVTRITAGPICKGKRAAA